MKIVIAMICFRVAKSWNQTGNKWLGTPDITLYLSQHPHVTNILFTLVVLFFSIAILGCLLRSRSNVRNA